MPGCGVYVTNILQQVTTRIYDAANRVLVVSNALGEKTVTTSDMLGRVLSVQTFAAGASTPLRVTSYAYSADHHSVTVTEGSGAGAIVSTTFTDNDGHRAVGCRLSFQRRAANSRSANTTWPETSSTRSTIPAEDLRFGPRPTTPLTG